MPSTSQDPYTPSGGGGGNELTSHTCPGEERMYDKLESEGVWVSQGRWF